MFDCSPAEVMTILPGFIQHAPQHEHQQMQAASTCKLPGWRAKQVLGFRLHPQLVLACVLSRYYNMPSSDYYQIANKLQAFVDQYLANSVVAAATSTTGEQAA